MVSDLIVDSGGWLAFFDWGVFFVGCLHTYPYPYPYRIGLIRMDGGGEARGYGSSWSQWFRRGRMDGENKTSSHNDDAEYCEKARGGETLATGNPFLV